MRRLATIALVTGLMLLAGCSGGDDAVDPEAGSAQRFVAGSGESSEIAAGDRKTAPNITGTLVDGGKFSLKDKRGDVVVLNFWASWCGPCRAEADDLERVYRATKARGVQFVGVNVRDSRSSAVAYGRSFGVTYPSLYDYAGRVALQLRAAPPNATPATIVIDRQGRIAAVFRKALLDDELQPVVTRVAAET